jgi:bifunctional UDP-N-acetylglucosamine pyrophosphorylase/glucosamine-1-phosphate N-acetyltransferase
LALPEEEEALGVNTRAELALAGQRMRDRTLNRLMAAGVTIVDPASTWIDADVEIGMDTLIEPGCVIQGATRIGSGAHLKPGCVIESSRVGDDVEMGPNAHLRPNCVIGDGSRIGNFVEVKNSVFGPGVKADHLSYIGDADVGPNTNLGAATITSNYDGFRKHRTTIGANVRTSVDTTLVAPVTVGDGAYTAANSAITEDVPPGALGIARERQTNIEGYAERRKKREAPDTPS